MKLKTKKEIEKELELSNQIWLGLQKTLEITLAEKATLADDKDALFKVISSIGIIVIGPEWLQSYSHRLLIEAVKDLVMQNNLSVGMFNGMKEAHRVALDKLSTLSNKLDLQK